MAVINFSEFAGEFPKITERKLPEGGAVTAKDFIIRGGKIEPVKGTTFIKTTDIGGTVLAIFRYTSSNPATDPWFESVRDVTWVRVPIVDDLDDRVIIMDPDIGNSNQPQITWNGGLIGGPPFPQTTYFLEVPAPTASFSATLLGNPDDIDEVPETRFYVCTFVTGFGSEGPPSPVSNEIEWRSGQAVDLTNLPSFPAGPYNLVWRRIYRINTGASGATVFQFVSQIAAVSNPQTVTGITSALPVVVTVTAHDLTSGNQVLMTTAFNAGSKVPAVSITNITQSTNAAVTATAHGMVTGDNVFIDSVIGMTEINDLKSTITRVSDNVYTCDDINSNGFTPYSSAGNSYEDEIDAVIFVITVIDANTFSLDGLDGSAYTAYISGGTADEISGTTYLDVINSESLGEALPSEIYDPANLLSVGVIPHPQGFLAAFYGNDLAFSEPGAPHAWPLNYRLTTDYDIIGLGVFGNTILVTTKGFPYLAIGTDPAAINLVELDLTQSCVSKRGIVDVGGAVMFPSPDGLIKVTSRGPEIVTDQIFTREQWQALKPDTFLAFQWEGKYLCFYDDGTTQASFVINPFDQSAGVTYYTTHATAGYEDLEEDVLYLVVGTDLVTWDTGAVIAYEWKSKPNVAPQPINLGVGKVIAESYPISIEIYADGSLRYTREVQSKKAFRMKSGYKATEFQLVVKGTASFVEATFTSTMREMSAV